MLYEQTSQGGEAAGGRAVDAVPRITFGEKASTSLPVGGLSLCSYRNRSLTTPLGAFHG